MGHPGISGWERKTEVPFNLKTTPTANRQRQKQNTRSFAARRMTTSG